MRPEFLFVLKVGDVKYYEVGLLAEANLPDSPPRAITLPGYDEYAEFTEDSGGSVLSLTQIGPYVRVEAVGAGKAEMTCKAFYPNETPPTSYQVRTIEFVVYAPGSQNDVFGAFLRPAHL